MRTRVQQAFLAATCLVMALGAVMFMLQALNAAAVPALAGTCVILFGSRASPMARPRAVLGGHVISAMIGVAACTLFGTGPATVVGATACSLALMMLTDTIHSPAGANPMAVAASHASWGFVVPVTAGVVVLLLLAAVIEGLRLGVARRGRGRSRVDVPGRSRGAHSD